MRTSWFLVVVRDTSSEPFGLTCAWRTKIGFVLIGIVNAIQIYESELCGFRKALCSRAVWKSRSAVDLREIEHRHKTM